MKNAQFDKLSPKLKLAYLLGTASRMFGRKKTAQIYRSTKPIVDDMFGHGKRRAPGEADDPSENYWHGVWRIYDAE